MRIRATSACTSGDGSVSPLDALLVINHLNTGGAGEGEGESVPVVLSNRLMAAQETATQYDSGLGSGSTIGSRNAGAVYGPAAASVRRSGRSG